MAGTDNNGTQRPSDDWFPTPLSSTDNYSRSKFTSSASTGISGRRGKTSRTVTAETPATRQHQHNCERVKKKKIPTAHSTSNCALQVSRKNSWSVRLDSAVRPTPLSPLRHLYQLVITTADWNIWSRQLANFKGSQPNWRWDTA